MYFLPVQCIVQRVYSTPPALGWVQAIYNVPFSTICKLLDCFSIYKPYRQASSICRRTRTIIVASYSLAMPTNSKSYCKHWVALVTGYLYPCLFVQHLLPSPAHALPQQVLPAPQGKLSPRLFIQHCPPGATH